MEKTLDRLHFFCDSCASSFWCLVKSLLFTCGGGYKYLYTGNRSRQVRCTWWDEVMSLYPPVHLFKCLSRMIVIPPRSISRCLVTFSHYWLCGHRLLTASACSFLQSWLWVWDKTMSNWGWSSWAVYIHVTDQVRRSNSSVSVRPSARLPLRLWEDGRLSRANPKSLVLLQSLGAAQVRYK